ncbi:MAG: hypothetical protein LC674_01455 [Actinobacteria bacterium]|nr:hypothetical protein [Actinomycetota bacterium]
MALLYTGWVVGATTHIPVGAPVVAMCVWCSIVYGAGAATGRAPTTKGGSMTSSNTQDSSTPGNLARAAAATLASSNPAKADATVAATVASAKAGKAATVAQDVAKAVQQVPVWALHTNPQVAKVLLVLARASNGDKDAANVALAKYGSAAALCRACNVHAKADQRQVRQVLRDAGMGVGRGNTYTGQVGRKLTSAARKVAKDNAKAAKAAAKA